MDGKYRHAPEAWDDVRASLDACLAERAFARRLYVRLANGPGSLARHVRAVDARRIIAGLPQALTTAVHFARGCAPAQYELERLALIHARAGLRDEPSAVRAIVEAVVAALGESDPHWSPALERNWRRVLAIAARGLRRAAPAA